MGSLLNNCPRLNSFLFVVGTIGDYFLQTLRLTSVCWKMALVLTIAMKTGKCCHSVLNVNACCTSIRHYCGAKKIVFLPSTTIPCCVASPWQQCL